MKFVFYNGFTSSINNGLYELLHILKDVENKIELYITGNDPLISSIGNVKIIFAGQKSHSELINFLPDKHFVIKSTAFDAFSIFTAECMTLGLIPIINNKTGIKDHINNESNGFIYSSEGDLKRLLKDIYDNKFDLSLISCNAKKIYEKLNWVKVAKEYIEAYQNLL